MCSWHDNITSYHNEEADDWYIDEGDLKDLAMNRSPLIRLFGSVDISQLQYSDNVVNISVGEIVQVPQIQVMVKTDRNPTEAAIVSQMLTVDKTVETFASTQHHHSIWS